MTRCYRVQTFYRIKTCVITKLPILPWSKGDLDPLRFYLPPALRSPYTAAHNQVLKTICTFQTKLLPNHWTVYEATRRVPEPNRTTA